MALIGYARVSTDEQDTSAQRDALLAQGCTLILEDKASGGSRERPNLARALERVGLGDTLLVVRIDRLARSLSHLLDIVETLRAKGSLIERCSRYVVLARNPSRHSKGVMEGIERHLSPLPPALRRSITFDRGTKFAAFATLQTRLGMQSYFCKPSAPWQEVSVENSNGRIRRFLPLDTDISRLSDAELAALTERLNHTPRKCLGFRTPAEVLIEQIAVHKAT